MHTEEKEEKLNAETDDESISGKALDKLSGYISMALLVIALIFVAYVMICTARGKIVKVFGRSVMKVVTGSMEPTIMTNDYIIIEETNVESLKINDIITFYSKDPSILDLPVTHRIIEINEDGSFVTKGDANDISDSVSVTSDRVIGKYIRKSRFFKWIDSFGGRRKILMLLVIIPVLIMAVFEVRSIAKLMKQVEEEKNKKALDHNSRTFEDLESYNAEIERIKKEAVEEYINSISVERENKQ